MSVEGQSKLLAGSSDRAEEMFMPGECPKQLANVESPLGFSGEGFSVFSQEKKKKILAAMLAKNARVARMCYFILGTLEAVHCWELHHPLGVY